MVSIPKLHANQYLLRPHRSDHVHKLWAVSCNISNQVDMNKSRFEKWAMYLYHQSVRTARFLYSKALLLASYLHANVICVAAVDVDGWGFSTTAINEPFFILQMIHEYGQPRWIDSGRRKPKNLEKTLSQCHYVHHDSHTDWLESEPQPPSWEAGNEPPQTWHGRGGCL